jgi:hypothetical protein
MNLLCSIVAILWAAPAALYSAESLKLDPENPHYFIFRGQRTILIGSSEHYSSVLNLDFNYSRYLDTVKADGLNVTRLFTGTYHERPGIFAPGFPFHIVDNVLAPKPESFLPPWPRTNQSGAVDGGNKFDLNKWNDAYFERLIDFVQQASQRGIVVEVSLFSPYYSDYLWAVSPFNARNNVNGIGNFANRAGALSLKDSKLVAVQDAMVEQIVKQLRGFDNVYYEICNEPYLDGVPLDWQAHIANTIVKAESRFQTTHLIAQEISLGGEKIDHFLPQASIFTFHLARPPNGVTLNYGLGKAIGYNESGGSDGTTDAPYRIQSWEFLMAGGALVDLLDYSFTVGHEDGSFVVPPKQPAGGSATLRRQLAVLHTFMNGLDFAIMSPSAKVIKAGVPENASAYALAEAGKIYAIYIGHGRLLKDKSVLSNYFVDRAPQKVSLTLDLPAGSYNATWIDPKTGGISKDETFSSRGDAQTRIQSPTYSEDIALKITRTLGS